MEHRLLLVSGAQVGERRKEHLLLLWERRDELDGCASLHEAFRPKLEEQHALVLAFRADQAVLHGHQGAGRRGHGRQLRAPEEARVGKAEGVRQGTLGRWRRSTP